MELKIEQYTPASPIQFNYEELKTELEAKAKMYASVVYTEDMIKTAKSDRAALNNLKKALNDERLRREREYMQPFTEFKTRINEIIGIIDEPIATIDTQVKAFEAKEKETKRAAIMELWEGIYKPEWLTIDRVWNDRFLNKSVSLSEIETDMQTFVNRVKSDVDAMERMNADDIAIEAYKTSLNVTAALDEAERIKKMREAAEARKREAEERRRVEDERRAAEAAAAAEAAQNVTGATENAQNVATVETVDDTQKSANDAVCGRWMKFEAFLTMDQAIVLRDFCKANGIELRKPQN